VDLRSADGRRGEEEERIEEARDLSLVYVVCLKLCLMCCCCLGQDVLVEEIINLNDDFPG